MGNKQTLLRGELLEFLQTEYVKDGIPEAVIVRTYYDYHSREAIEYALEYLTEKGYARKKEAPHPFREDEHLRWYKITARGIDLVERNIEADPGITLPLKAR